MNLLGGRWLFNWLVLFAFKLVLNRIISPAEAIRYMSELDPTRRERVTASMVPILMSGNETKITNLFLRCIGDDRYVDDGFSDSWPARYGMLIEPFALDYHQDKTGEPLIMRGEQLFHPQRPYVSCTLDAFRASTRTTIDCKAVGAYRDTDEVISYYTPQCLVQQECAQADGAALLIVKGGTEPQEVPVYLDPYYRETVWTTVDKFWRCVETLTPPFALQFPRIVPPELWRRVDLDRDAEPPNWAAEMRLLLEQWSKTDEPARTHTETKERIKSLLPDDVGRVSAGEFLIVRSRNAAVTVKYRKE
jgi:hypothetical protein